MNIDNLEGYGVPPLSPSIPDSPTQQRRRATLPSMIRASSDEGNIPGLWTLQAPRQLASAGDHGQGFPVRDSDIGVAVTSSINNNVNPESTNNAYNFNNSFILNNNNSNNGGTQKRRSRSAGALHELVRSQSGMRVRKRSDEIRYWRESLLPLSVTRFSMRSGNVIDPADGMMLSPSEAMPPANSTYMGTEKSQNAFNFIQAPEVEVADLEKDGQLADPAYARMKKRIDRLEIELAEMEHSMRKLKGRSHRQTVIMQEDGGSRSRRGRQSRWLHGREPEGMEEEERASSSDSSRTPPRLKPPLLGPGASRWRKQHHSHSPSYRTSSHSQQQHPYVSGYSYGLATDAPGNDRPNADQAIAAAAAAAAHEQVRALYLLLSQERSKRKALEVHISALQRNVSDVRDIATAAMASASKPHLYERPAAPFSHGPQITALPTQVLTGETAVLIGADPRRQTQVSRFSHFDSDDDGDGSGRTGNAGGVTSIGDAEESEAASNTNNSSRRSQRKSKSSSKYDYGNNNSGKIVDNNEQNEETIMMTTKEKQPENDEIKERTEEVRDTPTGALPASVSSSLPKTPSSAQLEGIQQRRKISSISTIDAAASRTIRDDAKAGAGTGLMSSPSLGSPETEDGFQTPNEEPSVSGFGPSSGTSNEGGQGAYGKQGWPTLTA